MTRILSISLLCVTVALLLALTHLLQTDALSSVASDLRNSLHAPVFCVFALISSAVLQRFFSLKPAIGIAFVVAVTAGIGGEAVQYFGSGEASFADFGQDLLGTATGLALSASKWRSGALRSPGILRFLLTPVSLVAAIAIAAPPFQLSRLLLKRQMALPDLVTFEEPWEQSFYSPSNRSAIQTYPAPREWPTPATAVAEITLSSENYSGIEIDPVSDWSGYEYITFVIASADEQRFDLTVRIDDSRHSGEYSDRYNRSISLLPTPTKIRIALSDIRDGPATRRMRIDEIRSIHFFVPVPLGSERILLDDIRLGNE